MSDRDPAAGAAKLVAAVQALRPLTACDVYVAGPDAFVTAAAAALADTGVPAGQTFAAVA